MSQRRKLRQVHITVWECPFCDFRFFIRPRPTSRCPGCGAVVESGQSGRGSYLSLPAIKEVPTPQNDFDDEGSSIDRAIREFLKDKDTEK